MEAIIFDMDGVIVDSEYNFLESKTELLQDAGYDVELSYQYQFMGTTFEYMWSKMKEELNLPKTVQEYIDEMNLRRQQRIERDGVRAIKGAVDLIHRLHQAGFPLAVASSSPKHEILSNLAALKLDSYFEVLVSGEEVDHSKPAPDVFLKAAELLDVAPEGCLVFEDTKNGSLAAKAARMYCIGFENPDYPAQDLAVADQVVTDFNQVNVERLKSL